MNITLIGMPGCGKSVIGRALAQKTGLRFVDVDKVIIEQEGRTLAEIIDAEGDEGFRAVEDRVNASLALTGSVISPGGSVIYGQNAMAHLREISKVVYLNASQETLLSRLGDLHERGVSILPGQTFADLYAERTPLYEHFAHIRVDTDGLSVLQVVTLIRRLLKI